MTGDEEATSDVEDGGTTAGVDGEATADSGV